MYFFNRRIYLKTHIFHEKNRDVYQSYFLPNGGVFPGCIWVIYPLSTQHVNDLVKQWGPEHVPVDQQGLHGIARSRVVALSISH